MTSNRLPVLANMGAEINDTHEKAIFHANEAMGYAIRCGELLVQAKATVPHGKWLPWLRENITFAERTAQSYMRIARNQDKIRNTVADFGVGKALTKLSTPRRHALETIMEDVWPWLEQHYACQAERPSDPTEWSIEDAKACYESIKELDLIQHKHGICFDSDLCTVCSAP